MRVIFGVREDLVSRPGGDTIQILKTKSSLEDLGVEVNLSDLSNLDWQILNCDIVHIFNLQTPEISLPIARIAKLHRKPVAVSTIWWDLSHSSQVTFLTKRLRNIEPKPIWKYFNPFFKQMTRTRNAGYFNDIKSILYQSDILIPNSEEEMEMIQKDFRLIKPKYKVVMNAVDPEIFTPSSRGNNKRVICCARIEPTKNQLTLINAAAEIDGVEVTLVGRSGTEKKYNKKVRELIDYHGYDWLDGHIDQAEMSTILKQHSVHVLASFRESPGLSSLEALSCGLNAVISSNNYCPVNTYFSNWLNKYVFTSDPYNVHSVKQSIINALKFRVGIPHLPDSLTWKDVGRQTLEVYNEII